MAASCACSASSWGTNRDARRVSAKQASRTSTVASMHVASMPNFYSSRICELHVRSNTLVLSTRFFRHLIPSSVPSVHWRPAHVKGLVTAFQEPCQRPSETMEVAHQVSKRVAGSVRRQFSPRCQMEPLHPTLLLTCPELPLPCAFQVGTLRLGAVVAQMSGSSSNTSIGKKSSGRQGAFALGSPW